VIDGVGVDTSCIGSCRVAKLCSILVGDHHDDAVQQALEVDAPFASEVVKSLQRVQNVSAIYLT
jgi:hypothetical protein